MLDAQLEHRRDPQLITRPKVLTVWQPWAWLIICGPKRVENRSWRPHYRGPLLIHVGQGWERRRFSAWADYVRHHLDELEERGLISRAPERQPASDLADALDRFERGGMRHEQAPLVAVGEAMTYADLRARVAARGERR